MADDSKKKDQISRREAVTGASALVAAWFTSRVDARGKRILRVDETIASTLAPENEILRHDSSECEGLTKELLGRSIKKVSAVRAKGNPHYGDVTTVSPSSAYAMEVVIDGLGLRAGDVVSLSEPVTTPDGILFSFGGPFNNDYSRAVLGTGRGSPLLELVDPSRITLPVMFDLERVARHPDAVEPHWPVLIYGVDTGFSEDCLLLTVVPNPYSSIHGPDDRIEILAARHRAGMMATGRIFSEARRLERLVKKTRGLKAWQALIPVKTRDLRTPEELGVEEVFEIEADFEKLYQKWQGVRTFESLLGSSLLIRPKDTIDDKRRLSDKLKEEPSSTERVSTRSDAVRRSDERARIASPSSEHQMSDPSKDSAVTPTSHPRLFFVMESDGSLLFLYKQDDGKLVPIVRRMNRPFTPEEVEAIVNTPLGF